MPVGTNETSNLPVLIYYHGGGYQAGSARSAPPEWLLASSKEPFIFATFQYRLGQFGFLGIMSNCLPESAPLNDVQVGQHLESTVW